MTDAEEKEYMEGKIQGLTRMCEVLVNHIEGFWLDIPTGLEWRIAFRTELSNIVAGLEKSPEILTTYGKGQRDAIAEFTSHFFSH